MFVKLFTVVSIALLAAATPTPTTGECDTGSLQCCDSTQSASDPSAALVGLLTLLGVDVSSISALVGVTCTPITVRLLLYFFSRICSLYFRLSALAVVPAARLRLCAATTIASVSNRQ